MDATLTQLLNGSNSLYLDSVAWTATQTSTWIPFMLALLYVIFRAHYLRRILTILFLVAICILVADQLSSSLFKPMVARLRPTHEPALLHSIDIVNGYRGGWFGFFSSHAANTCAVATFFSLLFRHRAATLCLFSWSLINCWTRVYLGVHYVGDLLFGLLIGAFIGATGYLFYHYRIQRGERHTYDPQLLRYIPLTFSLLLALIAIPWRLLF
ncbi:MAG: phosphatase PAP2 family protein [Bacteroidaceae bacterium]|nr:phosphatase PAP2 family protein [Bacteroidaceae bacterium]